MQCRRYHVDKHWHFDLHYDFDLECSYPFFFTRHFGLKWCIIRPSLVAKESTVHILTYKMTPPNTNYSCDSFALSCMYVLKILVSPNITMCKIQSPGVCWENQAVSVRVPLYFKHTLCHFRSDLGGAVHVCITITNQTKQDESFLFTLHCFHCHCTLTVCPLPSQRHLCQKFASCIALSSWWDGM